MTSNGKTTTVFNRDKYTPTPDAVTRSNREDLTISRDGFITSTREEFDTTNYDATVTDMEDVTTSYESLTREDLASTSSRATASDRTDVLTTTASVSAISDGKESIPSSDDYVRDNDLTTSAMDKSTTPNNRKQLTATAGDGTTPDTEDLSSSYDYVSKSSSAYDVPTSSISYSTSSFRDTDATTSVIHQSTTLNNRNELTGTAGDGTTSNSNDLTSKSNRSTEGPSLESTTYVAPSTGATATYCETNRTNAAQAVIKCSATMRMNDDYEICKQVSYLLFKYRGGPPF